MKKTIALLLTVMMTLAMAACGSPANHGTAGEPKSPCEGGRSPHGAGRRRAVY